MIGQSLYAVLSFRKDEAYYNLVKDWNKTIVIDVEGFYPVAAIFQGNTIKFDLEIPRRVNLKVTMDLDTMLDVAYKRLGAIKGALKRKIRIKGMYKPFTILKFMKVFLKSMKMAAAQTNSNYFEVEKITK